MPTRTPITNPFPAVRIPRVLLAFLCAVLPLFAAEPVKVRLMTDWYPQPEHGGFYQALLKGWYREAGLDVEIVPGGPNAFAIQRVATKAGDFGMGSTDDVILANERGIPMVAVGATMQHDPQGILIHEGSAVRGFPDLEGRTLALTPGTAWFPYLVKKYGLKKVREVAHPYSVGPFVRDTNALQQCFVTSEPFFAAQAGVKTRVLLIQESGYDPYRVFFTRAELVREKPEMVKAFVQASIRGWKSYLEDPAAVHAEIRRRNPELTPEKMDYSLKALKDGAFVTGDPAKGEAAGRMVSARWQFQYDTLRDLGVTRGRSPLESAWTDRFIDSPKP
jgi:NitT/TauT family transport system substrate-binding protein